MKKFVFVAIVVALAATACGGSDQDTVTVYSGRSENLIGPLLEDFTAATGIAVDIRYGQSAELALLIDQEGDKSPADVFISQSPGALGLLAGEGRLGTLSTETMGLVEEGYRNATSNWVGLSGRIRVLVYNSNLVEAPSLPESIFEIVDPAYRGRVAVAPGNGSFQDFVTGMREIHGDDTTLTWLEGLKDNDAPTYANNSSIVQAVARGEVEMGLVNHYYNHRALAEDPTLSSVNHYFQDVGSLVIITAAGVLEGSDHRDSGEELIRYLLGSDAQSFFSQETFEYPLATGSEADAVLTSLGNLSSTTYDFDGLSGGLERTKELIDESGLEAP